MEDYAALEWQKEVVAAAGAFSMPPPPFDARRNSDPFRQNCGRMALPMSTMYPSPCTSPWIVGDPDGKAGNSAGGCAYTLSFRLRVDTILP